ncbi:MAG: family 78 glycoside hydrolase catalytic domain [Chitinophagaceae bacterium]
MKKTIACLLMAFIFINGIAQTTVSEMLCENMINPIGIGEKKPRFTWKINATAPSTIQTAYELIVRKGKQKVWNTGKVVSAQSVFVEFEGLALEPDTKYNWQVRVWDNHGNTSAWSVQSTFQTAFFDSSSWQAKWIGIGFEEDKKNRPAQYFRNNINIKKDVLQATAYITSQGMYEASINGSKIGNGYLTPGWTSYKKRLQYQVYDVASYLKKGNNTLGAVLGNGWFRGTLGWSSNVDIYGKELGLLMQLNVVYADGTKEVFTTDENWKSSYGAILSNEIYHGEEIDARKDQTNWNLPIFNATNWKPVKILNSGYKHLIATENELITSHEKIQPIKIFTTPKGERVLDFGQNLVGWVKIKVKGNSGDSIIIKHAEVLDKFGNFYIDNMRSARTTAKYILSGKNTEEFEPHFTFFGFRYIKVEGSIEEIKPENFTAIVLHSNMKSSGSFSSSDPLVNQLQQNIQWGQKGNFLDVPTDCPQRDERLGWTGDAQVFSRTAAFNYNVHNFFNKWLKDLEADQLQNGSVPHVIPNVLGAGASGSAGWADVATIAPWNMYLVYGDKKVLENQYASMKAWVGFMEQNAKNDLWNKGFHFGDWLFYRPFDDNDGRAAVTDKYMIAQCFYANSIQLLINAAKVLDKNEDVSFYTDRLKKVKDAYVKEYMTSTGRLVSGTQTAYLLALQFDMLPEHLRQSAADRLVENITSYNTHLSTGFLGTPYLCEVLTKYGKVDVAYKLLMQKTFPSWLYPVKMGATTIWERWGGMHPDSTFEPASMNSFNHYAYGAIGDWMYRAVVGIDNEEGSVGYKKIRIKPYIVDTLTYASASLETYFGKVSNSWKINGKQIVMETSIPANTSAVIYYPSQREISVNGKKEISEAGIKFLRIENGYSVYEVGSGAYRFEGNR